MRFLPKKQAGTSFCEQKEAKKLFIRFGDSALSRHRRSKANESFLLPFFKKEVFP
jgi:hypothetical protein